MDLRENNNDLENVLVKFVYQGETKEVRTNNNGRATVTFAQKGNGVVTADPEVCDTQSMSVVMPNCGSSTSPTPTPAPQGGRSRILGATTLADTGSAQEYFALAVAVSGMALTLLSGYGYQKALR
jgi:hypothetical protein